MKQSKRSRSYVARAVSVEYVIDDDALGHTHSRKCMWCDSVAKVQRTVRGYLRDGKMLEDEKYTGPICDRDAHQIPALQKQIDAAQKAAKKMPKGRHDARQAGREENDRREAEKAREKARDQANKTAQAKIHDFWVRVGTTTGGDADQEASEPMQPLEPAQYSKDLKRASEVGTWEQVHGQGIHGKE